MELDFVPSEDEIEGYIPLERPSNNLCSNVQNPAPKEIVYSDDDNQNCSSSESSDDAHIQIVKTNLKRKAPTVNLRTNSDEKKKKFSIWSDILQEDAIENQFVDSNFFGGSYRGNESYNYRLKHLMVENQDIKNSDKTYDSVPRKKLKAWTKYRTTNAKKSSIILQNLDVIADDTPEKVASDIANKLNEPKTDIIGSIVNTLGNEKAIEIYNKTQETEKNGGLMIINGSRRRTSGGVYLKFVKDEKLPKKIFETIFMNSEFSTKKSKLKKYKLKGKGKSGLKTQEDAKSLPLRYELELSVSNDENDTNVLKNPPPSPVYLSASSMNPFSLSDSYPISPSYSPSSPNYQWSPVSPVPPAPSTSSVYSVTSPSSPKASFLS
ncbi:hypothetical protein PGB90_004888 [Kerria lacca]